MAGPIVRATLIVLVLTIVICRPAHSQDAGTDELASSFAITAVSVSGQPDQAFASLMTGFLVTEMEDERLTAASYEPRANPESSDTDAIESFLAAEINNVEQDFLIVLPFSRSGGDVTFDYYCIDVDTGRIVYSERDVTTKQLLIDIELSRLASKTVDQLSDRVVRQAAGSRNGWLFGSGSSTDGSGSADTGGASGETTWSLRPETAKFHIGVGVGSFRTVGRAESYFRSGIMPTSTADFGIATAAGRIGIGVRIASCFFDASSDAATAKGVLAPFAASVGFASRTGIPVDVGFSLGGGGSVLSLNVDDAGYQSKIMPFASAGAAAILRLTKGISIRAAVEAMVYFEREYPIFGYSPSLSIEF